MNEESIVPVLRGPSEPHQISSHEPLVLEVVQLLHVFDRLNLEPVKKPKLVRWLLLAGSCPSLWLLCMGCLLPLLCGVCVYFTSIVSCVH